MTKYILIGGHQTKANKVDLSRAIFEDRTEKVIFLICLFARNKAVFDWNELFEENKDFFSGLSQGTNIEFKLASEKDFLSQLKKSDVVYFSGGDSIPLYSALARIGNDWTKNLAGKTVIGSSASADMLTAYCFDIQQDQIDMGLGLVPVKTIVHFGANNYAPKVGWHKAKEILKEYGDKLPVYALKEGEFISISI
jgi:peptidase E